MTRHLRKYLIQPSDHWSHLSTLKQLYSCSIIKSNTISHYDKHQAQNTSTTVKLRVISTKVKNKCNKSKLENNKIEGNKNQTKH